MDKKPLGLLDMPQETISRVILEHKGPLMYETIGNLINSLKEKMDKLGLNIVIYKKLLLVMIESLENIYKYNEHFRKKHIVSDTYNPSFSLEKEKSTFVITSCNAVANEDMNIISDKISQVNELDAKGLKQLYKDTITNGEFSKRGGAGLGFIEIAKISTDKLHYSFAPIDKQLSYYKLRVKINEDFYKN